MEEGKIMEGKGHLTRRSRRRRGRAVKDAVQVEVGKNFFTGTQKN